MDEQKQQLIERINQAQNILVTVSANPSVDQLSAAIGLTVALNKLNKHGTAVFSGTVPSTMEFLKPEKTLEKNTDSLRDFIIALDKSKADKLRYKVEDEVVRIFITPYKVSLSEKDLQFSQGDFNVDVVVCLGVSAQQDLDTAITAHGRILHDATVVSVSTVGQGNLGTINWVDPAASSLSEMMVALVTGLDKTMLDEQIATALLTGIVATTDRFRNEKTSPKAMSASAELMAAGANQQLIATELETPPQPAPEDTPPMNDSQGQPDGLGAQAASTQPDGSPLDNLPEEKKPEPGLLEIDHKNTEPVPESDIAAESDFAPSEEPVAEPEVPSPQIHINEDGKLHIGTEPDQPDPSVAVNESVVTRGLLPNPQPVNNNDLTANINPEQLDASTEQLSRPLTDAPLLSHNADVVSAKAKTLQPLQASDPAVPPPILQPAPPAWQPPQTPPPSTQPQNDDETLTEIEEAVHSPHVQTQASVGPTTDSVEDARNAVQAALNSSSVANDPFEPITSLGAQSFGDSLHPSAPSAAPSLGVVPNQGFNEPTTGTSPADEALDMPLPSNPFGPGQQVMPPLPPSSLGSPSAFPGAPQFGSPSGGTPPPPVPPPMLPPLQ